MMIGNLHPEKGHLDLIEAVALLKPLPAVATAVGGNVELVVEAGSAASGHLVPPHKPAMLAERLAGLLRDPQRARALGAAGRKRVQQELTLEEMTCRTGDLYRTLLATTPCRQAA